MKVLLKNDKRGLTSYEATPCGNGDTIEIRNYYKNGNSRYVSGRGTNWWRFDGQPNNQPHHSQLPAEENGCPNE